MARRDAPRAPRPAPHNGDDDLHSVPYIIITVPYIIVDVMRHAHRARLRTTATMMYGTVETDAERLEHLVRLRELQDETGGFTAFITWSYQPDHTELGGVEATGVDYLRTLAIARIMLDNFDNLQASWVTH